MYGTHIFQKGFSNYTAILRIQKNTENVHTFHAPLSTVFELLTKLKSAQMRNLTR